MREGRRNGGRERVVIERSGGSRRRGREKRWWERGDESEREG